MKITIIQSNIEWEDHEENIRTHEDMIRRGCTGSDLVILPEMFTTGFSMNSRALATDLDGPEIKWMEKMSTEGDFGLVGSLIMKEEDRYLNRLVFMKPGGSYSTYDKGHLFRMEKEDLYYTKGSSRLIESFRGFNINLMICYDLRFPVWSRNVKNEYDLLIYVANWPEARRHVWNTLLAARAIENQCYVAGVNRIGSDDSGIFYSGDSVILDPRGEVLASVEAYKEGTITMDISMDKLKKFRNKFPVWKDADKFRLL